MAVNIGTLRGYLELDTTKWVSRLQQSAAALDDIGDRAEKLGKNMSIYLTTPLVGVAAVATKTFVSFESAMKGVEAALSPTAAQLKRLEDAAVEWGAKTQFSATESAEALGELGKAGFSVEESIGGLPSVLQLATVAKMGLADAATLTADTLTQFNLKVEDAGRVNDILAAGAQASTIDVQQLGESLKYAGPVAAGFGLSIEDTVGALAEFGNSGIKASMAGTALRGILTDIVVPTKSMSDGMAKLGIDTLAASDGTVKLATVIDTLRAKGATAADVMTMFGDRAGPVMVSLVNKGSDGLRNLTQQMYEAQRATDKLGAAQKASETMMSGLGGALEQMRGSVETAGMAVGRVLAPAVMMGANAIGALADVLINQIVPAFQGLPMPLQVVIGVIVGLTAAAGPALFVIGQIARAAALGAEGFDLIVWAGGGALRTLRDVGAAGADLVTGLLGWGRAAGAARQTLITVSEIGSAAATSAASVTTLERAALGTSAAQSSLALSTGTASAGLLIEGRSAGTASMGLLSVSASAGIASASNVTLTASSLVAARSLAVLEATSLGTLTRFAGAGSTITTSFGQIGRAAQLALPSTSALTTITVTATQSVGLWARAVGLLSSALAAIGGPITLVIAGAAALVGGIRYLTGSWATTWDVVKVGLPFLLALEFGWKAIRAALEALRPVGAATISFFQDVWTVMSAVARSALADSVQGFYAFGRDALTLVVNALRAVASVLSPVWSLITDLGSAVATAAKFVGGLFVEGLRLSADALRLLVPGFADMERVVRGSLGWLGQFWEALKRAREGLHELAEALRMGLPEVKPPAIFNKGAGGAVESIDDLLASMNRMLPGEEKLRASFAMTGRASDSLVKQLAAARRVLDALTPAQRANVEAGLKLTGSAKETAEAFNQLYPSIKLTEQHIDLYKDRMSDSARATKDHAAEVKKAADAVQALRDQFSGKDLIDNALRVSGVLHELGANAFTKVEMEGMVKTFGDALEKIIKTGQDKTPAFAKLTKDWVTALDGAMATTPWDNDVFWVNFFKDPPGDKARTALKQNVTAFVNTTLVAALDQSITPQANAKFWNDLLGQMPDVTPDMSEFAPNMLKSIGKELTKAEFGLKLGTTIIDSITSGASADQIGSAIGSVVGTAIGFGISSGNPIVAQALGTAGALVGQWIGGLFGGDDEAAAATRRLRDQMLQSFGGTADAFRRIAEEAGLAGRQIELLLTTGDPSHFQAEWDTVSPKLQQLKTEYDGLSQAVAGANTLAEGLAMNLKRSMDAQAAALKLTTEEASAFVFSASEDQQLAIDRLGTFVTATFADMVRRSGDTIGAVLALKPAFKTIQDSVEKFGLTGNAATQHLLTMYRSIEDNEDVFSSLSGLGQLMTGLGKAMVTNKGLGEEFGQELSFQLKNLTDRGVDTEAAMAMMQPQLQQLWEHSEKFGEFTDEGTRALLAQAEQYGLVGPEMREINAQILDVLVDIRDMFANDIPGAIPRTQRAIDSLTPPPPMYVDIYPRRHGDDVPDVPGAAHGIHAFGPTLAWFGEGGEEELGGSVGFMSKALAGAFDEIGDGVSSGGRDRKIEVHNHMDLRGALVGDYASQQQLAKLISDAVITEVERKRQLGTAGYR